MPRLTLLKAKSVPLHSADQQNNTTLVNCKQNKKTQTCTRPFPGLRSTEIWYIQYSWMMKNIIYCPLGMIISDNCQAGREFIKHFACWTQLSTKLILLINVKMPTIVGILTFISMINTTSQRLKARNFFICRYFSFMSRWSLVLSWVEYEKSFITSGPVLLNDLSQVLSFTGIWYIQNSWMRKNNLLSP